jgi:zinc protease
MIKRLEGPASALLLVEENRDLPLVRVQATLRSGAGDDAPAHDGLANFGGELLSRGAAKKSRAEIDAAFDALGTSLDVLTDYDSVTFEFTVLKEKLDVALALLADVLLRPDFAKKEADKLRRELSAHLDELRDEDGQLARRFFARALYGEHPYGRTVLGTEASLESLTFDRARAWHERVLRGGSVVFGIAGDVVAEEIAKKLERHFGALPAGEVALMPRPTVARRHGMRITVVDKPERTQSQILIGQPAPRWSDPTFLGLQVATTAFGGTFTARLMEEVRSKRGLSYGASARLGHGRGARALVAHVFPSLEQTVETLALVLGLYRDWVVDGISDEETTFARGYLGKSFALSLATPEDRLELAVALQLTDMPRDYADTFVAQVSAVEKSDCTSALQLLSPTDLEIVIVSTAAELVPRLTAARLLDEVTVEVVPYDSY